MSQINNWVFKTRRIENYEQFHKLLTFQGFQ
jgi:hypothetical protein